MTIKLFIKLSLLLSLAFTPLFAEAGVENKQPFACLDEDRQPLSVDNNLPLNLKEFTENRYEARVFVSGIFVKINQKRNKHMHFEIDLDEDLKTQEDRLEVIYNEKYGSLPQTQTGASVLVCGDYITAKEDEDGYPASPQGAIIHWTHSSEFPKSHPHGFLLIDGNLISHKIK